MKVKVRTASPAPDVKRCKVAFAVDANVVVDQIARASNKTQVLRLLVASLDDADRKFLLSSLDRHTSKTESGGQFVHGDSRE